MNITIEGIGDYKGALVQRFTIAKAANPLKASAKAKKVKLKKVRKKKQTVAPITVRGAQGTLSFKVVGGKKKAKKALKINAKTGKVTVKKRTKKGKYTIKVRVTAAGTSNYLSTSKTLTVTVKVK